jgi:hypothetical protein
VNHVFRTRKPPKAAESRKRQRRATTRGSSRRAAWSWKPSGQRLELEAVGGLELEAVRPTPEVLPRQISIIPCGALQEQNRRGRRGLVPVSRSRQARGPPKPSCLSDPPSSLTPARPAPPPPAHPPASPASRSRRVPGVSVLPFRWARYGTSARRGRRGGSHEQGCGADRCR